MPPVFPHWGMAWYEPCKVAVSDHVASQCHESLFQALGSIIFFLDFFFSFKVNGLVKAKLDHFDHHSVMTRALFWWSLEEDLWSGAGNGPMGGLLAASSASSLMQKPRWLGIHWNSMWLASADSSQHCRLWLFCWDNSNSEWALTCTMDLSVDWLSMKTMMWPAREFETNSIALWTASISASYEECAATNCWWVCITTSPFITTKALVPWPFTLYDLSVLMEMPWCVIAFLKPCLVPLFKNFGSSGRSGWYDNVNTHGEI